MLNLSGDGDVPKLCPPKPSFSEAKAETIAGTLNRKSGSNSEILIKVYRNYELSTKFTLNGLRCRNLNQIREEMPLIIRLSKSKTTFLISYWFE